MDHYSILDHSSSPPAVEVVMSSTGASLSATASISAGIAVANALHAKASEPGARFPGEDSGRSLAEMAQADLDAALQLLAERAQYITGAGGAAIALRRGDHNDMLCRASVGENAPELGALLSMEYGLSGESVRTRQLLRCDDAERDPRVNRDVCRELGIASVAVMPIVSQEQVLGVFELLSGKPRAFGERDLSALLRLSEMVETAIKHAVAAQTTPALPLAVIAESQPQADAISSVISSERKPDTPAMGSAPALPSQPAPPAKQEQASPVPQKPLFWSAAMRTQASVQPKQDTETIAVPPVLRKLQKCQVCGFPVSQGRAFCVECEERQWRGQRLPYSAAGPSLDESPASQPRKAAAVDWRGTFGRDSSSPQVSVTISKPVGGQVAIAGPPSAVSKPPQDLTFQLPESANVGVISAPQTPVTSSSDLQVDAPADLSASDNAAPFLSSALPSESWFAANKYILGALLVVAIVIGVITWLR